MNKKAINILIVDDDEVDVKMILRALQQARIANPVFTAKDGIDALDKLRAGQIDKPFIILMDLNMPRMDGISCMKSIREDNLLKQAVIFVLTTSQDEKDKLEAYNLNTAGYILKSDAGEGFLNAVEMLDCYWKVVELPES